MPSPEIVSPLTGQTLAESSFEFAETDVLPDIAEIITAENSSENKSAFISLCFFWLEKVRRTAECHLRHREMNF